MLVHYVEFYQPGTFFPETEERKVKDRTPAHLTKIPKDTYAIYYHDREEETSKGEKLTGKEKNRSKRIIFGEGIKLEDIPDTPDNCILRGNIDCNSELKTGIRCITGNWQALDREDILLGSYKDLKSLTSPI